MFHCIPTVISRSGSLRLATLQSRAQYRFQGICILLDMYALCIRTALEMVSVCVCVCGQLLNSKVIRSVPHTRSPRNLMLMEEIVQAVSENATV